MQIISNYKLQGTPNSPVLVFSNSLGTTMNMWDELVPYLLPYFRVLQYDTRGHGASEVTPEPYNIALLGQDVINLLDQLNFDKVYFCGLSMGGLIGQWLGINHPERLIKLIISNTNSQIGDNQRWNDRIKTISEQGMSAIADSTLERWFTDNFRISNPSKVNQTKAMFMANNTLGYINCCAAVRDANFSDSIKNISTETLIITGNEDGITDENAANTMAEKIPNSKVEILNARHLASTELPKMYSELLINFIVGEKAFDRGMHVRRTVLGNTHVNRANDNKNEFNSDFQEFISNYAWGEIWTRAGLSKHHRSLITLAMLIPLNRKSEFTMHIKAAFNNGVTKEEIKEVIMQSGIYCGLPAANEAIHSAEEVFKELGI